MSGPLKVIGQLSRDGIGWKPSVEMDESSPQVVETLKITSAQDFETSVTNSSAFQNYPHTDNHTMWTTDTTEFEPFTR